MILAKSTDLPSVAVPMTNTDLELTNWFWSQQFVPTQMIQLLRVEQRDERLHEEIGNESLRFLGPGVAKDDSK